MIQPMAKKNYPDTTFPGPRAKLARRQRRRGSKIVPGGMFPALCRFLCLFCQVTQERQGRNEGPT
jgi:hypothetical protein